MLRHVDRYTQRKKSRTFTEHPDLSHPVTSRVPQDTPAQTHWHAKASLDPAHTYNWLRCIYNNHDIALWSLRQYFDTFYKKAIVHTEERTRRQNRGRHHPRTGSERDAPAFQGAGSRVGALEARVALALTSLPAPQPPARWDINAPNSWSLPNEKRNKIKNKQVGRLAVGKACSHSPKELSYCRSSGPQAGHTPDCSWGAGGGGN